MPKWRNPITVLRGVLAQKKIIAANKEAATRISDRNKLDVAGLDPGAAWPGSLPSDITFNEEKRSF